jgi:hypothetical protein
MTCAYTPYLEALLREGGAALGADLQRALVEHVPQCPECGQRYLEAQPQARGPAPPAEAPRAQAARPPQPDPHGATLPPDPTATAWGAPLGVDPGGVASVDAYLEAQLRAQTAAFEPVRSRRRDRIEAALITLGVVFGLVLFLAWDFDTPESRESIERMRTLPVGPVAMVRVLREQKDGALSPAGAQMGHEDGLRYSYLNTAGWQRLLVFVVDDLGNVYWEFPEWTDRRQSPVAAPISSTPREQEIPRAVHRAWEGELLVVYTIFTNEVVSARDLEARLADRARDHTKPLVPGSQQSVVTLRLVRLGEGLIDPTTPFEANAGDDRPVDDPETPEDESAPPSRDAPVNGARLEIEPFSGRESWLE